MIYSRSQSTDTYGLHDSCIFLGAFLMTKSTFVGALAGAMLFIGSAAHATVITSYYGDDDGFGFTPAKTSGSLDANPFNIDNSEVGEAPFTDISLFSDDPDAGALAGDSFTPTGGFNFVLDGAIVSATLTFKVAALDPSAPEDTVELGSAGSNKILLDGIEIGGIFEQIVPRGDAANPNGLLIQAITVDLSAAVIAALTDGTVSLAGTRISDTGGAGSFMVDFLRLDIITDVGAPEIPIPAALPLFLAGLGALGVARRRRKQSA